MINKQSLWFITLFSLIIILGIYYVSIPQETLTVFSGNTEDTTTTIEVNESDILVAMKVEEEEKLLADIEDARKILLNETSSLDDKNNAYKTIQLLNNKKGKTQEIEKKIKQELNIDSFVKIDGNKITIVLSEKDQGKSHANKVINTVQSLYETQMYITIRYQG